MNIDAIRQKADRLCAGPINDWEVDALINEVTEAGAVGASEQTLREPQDAHRNGMLYMCPWHTCSATRHG